MPCCRLQESFTVIAAIAVFAVLAGCGSQSRKAGNPAEPTSRPANQTTDRAGAPGPEKSLAVIRIPAGPEFGAGITLDHVDEFQKVMTSPLSFASRPVLVRAEVIDVCKNKGCWMMVTDGAREARVRFHEYSFFVPKDCEGKTAWIEGVVVEQTVSVEDLRHYAAESGAVDPADITKSEKVVGFMATGVRLTD